MRTYIVYLRDGQNAVSKVDVTALQQPGETEDDVLVREASAVTTGPWFTVFELDAPAEHPMFWNVDFDTEEITTDAAAAAAYEIDLALRSALEAISEFAKDARAKISGTDDPAKLAEYADKAGLADLIIVGTATVEAAFAAREEALDRGMADIDGGDTAEVQLARIWIAKTNALRTARNAVNRLEIAARSAVDAAATPADIQTALDTHKAQAEAALAALLAQMSA